jgi:predicted transcriptional regulator
MIKESYHPNAHLMNIRNVKQGLRARTRALNILEDHSADAKTIGKEAEMSYRVVMHHLRLLEVEGTVERKKGRPHVWVLTGLGQKRLTNSR